jgi:VanZ family protein
LRDRILSWLPVAIWAALIYGSSTSYFGTAQTSRVIVPILHWLAPQAAPYTLDVIHEILRKCAHFGNYFVLGALLYRALRGTNRGWHKRWAIFAVLLAFSYASSDEYHQSFEAGRGPSAMDALLDTTGAAAAQLVLWSYFRWREQIPTNVVPESKKPAPSS